jgi:hypothetical protein
VPARELADPAKSIHLSVKPAEVEFSRNPGEHGSQGPGAQVRILSPQNGPDSLRVSPADDLQFEAVGITVNENSVEPIRRDDFALARKTDRPGSIQGGVPLEKLVLVAVEQGHVPSHTAPEPRIEPSADAVIAKKVDAKSKFWGCREPSPQRCEILYRVRYEDSETDHGTEDPLSAVPGPNEVPKITAPDKATQDPNG